MVDMQEAVQALAKEMMTRRDTIYKEFITKFMPEYWLNKVMTERNADYFTFFGLRFETLCWPQGRIVQHQLIHPYPNHLLIYQWDRLALEVQLG